MTIFNLYGSHNFMFSKTHCCGIILFYTVNICHLNRFNKKLTGRKYRQDSQTKDAGMKKDGAKEMPAGGAGYIKK